MQPRRAQDECKRNPLDQVVGRDRGAEHPRDLPARRGPQKAHGSEDLSEESDQHDRPMADRVARRAEVADAEHADHHSEALPDAAAGARQRLHSYHAKQPVTTEKYYTVLGLADTAAAIATLPMIGGERPPAWHAESASPSMQYPQLYPQQLGCDSVQISAL